MNDSIFANLPRFDEHAYANGVAHVDGGEETEAGDAEPVETPEEVFERKIGALDQTLASLADVSDQLQQAAAGRAKADLTALAEKLFPKLTEAFLAEEIMRHLPDLVPQSRPRVEIRAEPELAEPLQALIEQSNRLAGFCHVIADEAPGPNRATVSWGDGGIDFDFESLLEACMRRLKAA